MSYQNLSRARDESLVLLPLKATPRRVRAIPLYRALDVSRSTFYAGVKSGRYPRPDGYDGKMPFWFYSSVRYLLEPTQSA